VRGPAGLQARDGVSLRCVGRNSMGAWFAIARDRVMIYMRSAPTADSRPLSARATGVFLPIGLQTGAFPSRHGGRPIMRPSRTFTATLATFVCLVAISAFTISARAQEFVYLDGSPGQVPPAHRAHAWGLCSHRALIPRTYSYQYAPWWFNQPRHVRTVGPDGRISWRTTVRGLPLGTPWLSR
jgi:hypothetical protein